MSNFDIISAKLSGDKRIDIIYEGLPYPVVCVYNRFKNETEDIRNIVHPHKNHY